MDSLEKTLEQIHFMGLRTKVRSPDEDYSVLIQLEDDRKEGELTILAPAVILDKEKDGWGLLLGYPVNKRNDHEQLKDALNSALLHLQGQKK